MIMTNILPCMVKIENDFQKIVLISVFVASMSLSPFSWNFSFVQPWSHINFIISVKHTHAQAKEKDTSRNA